MTGRNSAISSVSPPKPSSKSRRNARHPTTRKWPREARARSRPTPGRLASLVEITAFTGALRRGILGTISATTETENKRRYREDSWLVSRRLRTRLGEKFPAKFFPRNARATAVARLWRLPISRHGAGHSNTAASVNNLATWDVRARSLPARSRARAQSRARRATASSK
jgi:hypothetical protein